MVVQAAPRIHDTDIASLRCPGDLSTNPLPRRFVNLAGHFRDFQQELFQPPAKSWARLPHPPSAYFGVGTRERERQLCPERAVLFQFRQNTRPKIQVSL